MILRLLSFSPTIVIISWIFYLLTDDLVSSIILSIPYIWLMTFTTYFVHELGHYLANLYYGVETVWFSIGDIKDPYNPVLMDYMEDGTRFTICLFAIEGFVLPSSSGHSRLSRFQIAMSYFAGPLADFILSLVLIPFMVLAYWFDSLLLFMMLLMICIISFLTGFMNLLPVFEDCDGTNILDQYRKWRSGE